MTSTKQPTSNHRATSKPSKQPTKYYWQLEKTLRIKLCILQFCNYQKEKLSIFTYQFINHCEIYINYLNNQIHWISDSRCLQVDISVIERIITYKIDSI